MSAGLFSRLRQQTANPYGRALCDTMVAFFQARTPEARAELLWAFAKEHGREPGHDIGKWNRLIRSVEERPVPGGAQRIEARDE